MTTVVTEAQKSLIQSERENFHYEDPDERVLLLQFLTSAKDPAFSQDKCSTFTSS